VRILYLCHRIPFPPDKGDKIRSYHQVEFLGRRHEVDLFTLIDDAADREHVGPLGALVRNLHVETVNAKIQRLRSLGGLVTGEPLSVRAFADRRLQAAVTDALQRESYDLALVFSSNMTPYLGDWDGPRAYDFVDVDSAKWTAYAETAKPPMNMLYAREGRRLRALEAAAAARAELTVVCADKEREELLAFCRPRRVETVPNGTDVEFFKPAESDLEPTDVVFTGAMDYRANVDAVTWFVEQCLPRLAELRPGVRVAVVGSNPTRDVQALGNHPGVTVTGRVPDVRPWLRAAKVSVAPLRVARGIQNKVLEAMACGVPVVATTAALGGIVAPGSPLGPDAAVRVDEPSAFADAVSNLLGDAAERARRGAEGREWVVQHFDWESRLMQLESLLLDVASRRSRDAVEDDEGAGVPTEAPS